MLWRMHRDGWAFNKECRKRQFDEERQALGREIRKMKAQRGGSLGAPKADTFLNDMQGSISNE